MPGFNGEANGGEEWSNLYAASQGVWRKLFFFSYCVLVFSNAFENNGYKIHFTEAYCIVL